MRVRYALVCTTSSKSAPASANIARMFSIVWRVWLVTSSPTIDPSGPKATAPETNRNPFEMIPGERAAFTSAAPAGCTNVFSVIYFTSSRFVSHWNVLRKANACHRVGRNYQVGGAGGHLPHNLAHSL